LHFDKFKKMRTKKLKNTTVENKSSNYLNQSTEISNYPLAVLNLGNISISETDQLMKHFVKLRVEDKVPDLLLILSHYPVLSLGARKLDENDLLKPLDYFKNNGIELYQSNRGGGLTYHWQNQLVVYPIVKLRKGEQHISKYMFKLEEVGVRTLYDLGIKAERKRDNTAQIGLWHKEKKIASMGISISKWISSYGFAINLGGNFDFAKHIRPCGLDVQLTTVDEITGFEQDKKVVSNLIIKHFKSIFNRKEYESLIDINISERQMN
jgi:lipoyl(octanoyl) transferase